MAHAAALNPDLPIDQFYRRPLPAMCTSFCSPEGKAIFREALNEGYMEIFFPLASQFRTQEEPAFCGLSTLVMVLNTLEVDPGKVWKGPWRWYHENMLDCCVPINVIAKSGITFDQFSCLAVCNTLNVKAIRADETTSEEEFRGLLKRVSKGSDEVIVASYSRKALDQTGGGHFSPIAGYHPEKDLVLIMDVARFKYQPHWVKVHALFKGMQDVDTDTGLSRGYLLLSKSRSLPTVLFRLTANLCVNGVQSTKVVQFITDWKSWLSTPTNSPNSNKALDTAVNQLVKFLNLNEELSLMMALVEVVGFESISAEHRSAIRQILEALKNLPVYQVVRKYLPGGDKFESEMHIPVHDDPHGENFSLKLKSWHYVAMVLLIWPYEDTKGSFGASLDRLMADQVKGSASELLQNEVTILRQQVSSVLGYVAVCTTCTCKQKAPEEPAK
uniref:glutathione gamma-glutamylcysteinyltransferase n=1 Tax=Lumbricus rubellus TaxID=35632 RepID=V9VDK1_LUMRU|nr:phytochelatin synthase 1b [Lumbricus rubellus]